MKGLFDTLKDSLGSLTKTQNDKNGSNLGSLIGAGAVGSLVGMLLSGKSVRNLAKDVLAIGAGAAAASYAYKLLEKWRQGNNVEYAKHGGFGESSINQDNHQNLMKAEDAQALLLLQAMIFSSRADGFIDEKEREMIDKCCAQLGTATVKDEIHRFMTCPLDPREIASKVASKEQALDIYTLSATVIHCDNFMEESYLNGLAQALGLSLDEKKSLDAKALSLSENLKN